MPLKETAIRFINSKRYGIVRKDTLGPGLLFFALNVLVAYIEAHKRYADGMDYAVNTLYLERDSIGAQNDGAYPQMYMTFGIILVAGVVVKQALQLTWHLADVATRRCKDNSYDTLGYDDNTYSTEKTYSARITLAQRAKLTTAMNCATYIFKLAVGASVAALIIGLPLVAPSLDNRITFEVEDQDDALAQKTALRDKARILVPMIQTFATLALHTIMDLRISSFASGTKTTWDKITTANQILPLSLLTSNNHETESRSPTVTDSPSIKIMTL